MKKTIGALALGLAMIAGLGPGCARHTSKAKLEQRVTRQEIFDFNEREEILIGGALSMVRETYRIPNIVFLKKRQPTTGFKEEENWDGLHCGLCKNNKYTLPKYFDYRRFGDYHLVLLREEDQHKREKIEGWYGVLPNPIQATTIHEAGHVYFSLLPEKEQQEIVDLFTRIDLSLAENVPGNLHPGHASFYSYDKYLIKPGMTGKQRKKAAEEQWVEVLVYRMVGATHQNNDIKFHLKVLENCQRMERFKKSQFFTIK